ncbi:MAG: dephospho-CoA kinase [Sandaracinaceae bacterium]|nr:dephospho-CoA kinase [Sandaracinaceae bacterium]
MATATVGLTGGIASGKSAVAQIFTELGVVVVDADRLARDVVAVGTEGLREIEAAFGASVLLDDGSLDRKKLGAIVFGDPQRRAQLNAITHPKIAAESARRLSELAAKGLPYVIYDAALLVENGIHKGMSAVIVVAAAESIQVARLCARDGISEADARKRITSQLPLAEKIAVADYVIENNGTLAQLRARVLEVNDVLRARFAGAKE